MNIVQIAGRLGRDAETRFTQSGQKVTTLTVATNVRKAGKEETVWWRVTIWGDRFDKLMPYLKKGSALIIVGEMGKPDIWTDKEGRPQVSLELTAEMIKFNPFGGNGNSERSEQTTNQTQQNTQNRNQDSGFGDSQGDSQFGGFGSNSGQAGQGSHYSNSQAEEPLPF